METTPIAGVRANRRSRATPLSGARRTPGSTPRLTPNDDVAERKAARNRRQAERMRKSLAGTFDGADAGADASASQQQQTQQQQQQCMTDDELRVMLDLALKLAAENKINDRNVWSLPLIDHLTDMVHRAAPDAADPAAAAAGAAAAGGHDAGAGGAPGAAEGGAGGGNNYFTRISGGLDAGVQIYARRVDATWKLAYAQLHGTAPAGAEGADGGGDAGAGAGGGDAAKKRRRGAGGAEPREDDTLADADALRGKQGDAAFAVDPLFHKMSQIFDEDGAAGMLLLNRGVVAGSAIMFDAHDVPEDAFMQPLAELAPPPRDVSVDLAPLRATVAAARAAVTAAAPGSCAAVAPAMRELYALAAGAGVPLAAADEAAVEAEVAAIMAAVEPRAARWRAAGTAPAPVSDVPTMLGTGSGVGPRAVAACSIDMADAAAADDALAASRRAAAADAELFAELAGQYAAPAGDDDGAGAGGAYGDDHDDDDAGGGWDAGGDDGGSSDGDEPSGREARGADSSAAAAATADTGVSGGGSMLSSLLVGDGLEGSLGADSLALLAGLSVGLGGATRGAGWAGSSFWKFQRGGKPAFAASSRRGSSGGGDDAGAGAGAAPAAKRGAKKAAADAFIDFEAPPPLPADALAPGAPKATTLAACAAANTLLPEDVRYPAAALGRLFFKPHAVLAAAAAAGAHPQRRRTLGGGGRELDWGADPAAADGGAGAYDDDDDDDNGGGDDGGYGDYGGGDAGGFYDAAAPAAAGDNGELPLLAAPRRAAPVGVSYSRASKQVDVHALKDIIWRGVVKAPPAQAGGSGAAAVDFRDVIKTVPRASAAGRLEDLSVHMCFICLLHLANQHGLKVTGASDLATLTIEGAPPAGV